MPKFISDEEMSKIEGSRPAQKKKFISDEEMASLDVKPSEMESFIRGAGQGATFNLSDEGAGFLESPLGALKQTGKLTGLYEPDENDEDLQRYLKERDESRNLNKKAQEANPYSYMTGEFGGGAATMLIPGLNAAKAAQGGSKFAPMLAREIASGMAQGAGASEAASGADLAKDSLLSGGISAVAPITIGAGKKAFGRRAANAAQGSKEFAEEAVENSGLKRVVGGEDFAEGVPSDLTPHYKEAFSEPEKRSLAVSNYLRSKAEKLAENATGATGKQSEKFADNAGRELLDRKIVGFGDNAESIERKASEQMEASWKKINDTLKALDEKGGGVDKDSLLATIDGEIAELSKKPSKASVVRQLKTLREDVDAGPSRYNLSDAEIEKRGYQQEANYDIDKVSQLAKKKIASAYQKNVEGIAEKMDPSAAAVFKEGKKEYGLLAPIQEAAAKRAQTLNQSPMGGLLDTAAAGVGGAMVGGPIPSITNGVTAAFGRRQLAPRMSSAAAVTLDKTANFLDKINSKIPSMPQKYQRAMQSAAQRGGNAMAVTHFLLGTQNPEYQQYFNEEDEQ